MFYLDMKGKDTEYPQIIESQWLSDLAFVVDPFEHMKEFNTKLQVKTFQVKLKLFSCRFSQNITRQFPTLETMAPQITSTEKYTNLISALGNEFTLRIGDLNIALSSISCHQIYK
ncbi:General transcription factor II-I repeat domain-containing protein 2 [Thelohanellus kitauei]|uniref:General transcription factor II-I repeat domain-containing protein 2 n=1 Tax=Thelohanellus kitauei TaxID=669202 RepID=A0A0C2MK43_THEKT|nr:General transcription factor II-I repeat domain-containing protein 2 [Thelohanellus kitauei]